MKFRDLLEKYENDGEDYFPELKAYTDYYEYYEHLYNTDDLMCVKHKLHVIKSLKRKPLLINNIEKDFKIDGGKSGTDFIISGKKSKNKYNIEFQKDSIAIWKQTKPRQKIHEFEFYWSSMLRELI